jgi:hypothetical protein
MSADGPELPMLLELDSDCSGALEPHPRSGRSGEQCQVLSPQGRFEVGVRATPPGASALGHDGFAKAFVHRLIRLLDPISALFGRCSQEAVPLRGLR